MLKVGIIGAGYIAKAHMQVYSMLRDRVQTVAVCDTNPERAKSLAAQFRVAAVYGDHLDMLDKTVSDFIDICTPPSAHSKIAVDAANKGKHILVEKPMALTSAECRIMANESEKNHVSLCVCHDKIFGSPFLNAKRTIVDQNVRINLCSITVRIPQAVLQRWAATAKEGGLLWEAGSHAAYAQLFFLGEIDQVFATAKRVLLPVDDNFLVRLRGKSGTLGLIELACRKARAGWFHCSIDSEEGERFELDPIYDYFAVTRPQQSGTTGLKLLTQALGDIRRLSQMRMNYAIKYMSSGRMHFIRRTHITLISRFIDSLNNHYPPPVTAQDGLEAIRTLEAIVESIKKGRPVTL